MNAPLPPDLELLRAAEAFCEAPANTGLVERAAVAMKSVEYDVWQRRWPPQMAMIAMQAWQTLEMALKDEGELRRDWAAVLEAQLARLKLAARPKPKASPRSSKPRDEDPPQDMWWQRD